MKNFEPTNYRDLVIAGSSYTTPEAVDAFFYAAEHNSYNLRAFTGYMGQQVYLEGFANDSVDVTKFYHHVNRGPYPLTVPQFVNTLQAFGNINDALDRAAKGERDYLDYLLERAKYDVRTIDTAPLPGASNEKRF